MWIFVWIIFFCASAVHGQGFYKVTSSRAIRPNSEYHVAVSVQATSLPTTVVVTILGASFDGRPFEAEDVVSVAPYTTRIATIKVPDVSFGRYNLRVQGSGGISFQESKPLVYYPKSYSVFVQTDKSVYKPGSKIFFRAMVLNPNLRPSAEARYEPIDVHISDGKGNKVKEWRNVQAVGGVFTGELQLSESPVLGDWNISVTIHKQNYNKTIQVAQYILPKFLIEISAPEHVTFQDNIIPISIKSKYNYGRNVKGDATITVYPTIFSGVLQPIFQNPVRKVIKIDGSADVNFDISKELRLSDEYERTVIVDVTIQEELTGRRQNNSVEVHLHKYDYKIELIKTADYYKPGLKYVAFVKVSNYDGSPLRKDRRKITIRHGYSRADEVYAVDTYNLDGNGILGLELFPPRNSTNETALRIEADYYDLKERMPPIPAAVSPSNTFIQTTILTEKPTVKSDIEILINCTEPMKYINYELFGRGDIIIGNTYQVYDKKTFKFHFTATHAMVPISHLLVNYVREDGELVADSIDIEIDGLLQNFMEVQVNAVETFPGTEVDITVRANPNSYISLLGIDENAKKLRSGYDVTLLDVSRDVLSYDLAEVSPYMAVMKDAQRHFYWKQGSSNPSDTYHDSGAIIMTNAYVDKFRPTLEDIYLRPVSYGSSTVKPDRGLGISFQTATRPPLAGPYAFSRIPRPVWDKPKVYLTRDIADTWLFTNFSSGFEGKITIRRRLPSSLSTWVLSGFSLDFVNGLGLVSKAVKIKVGKPFVVTCDLPFSAKKGEIVAVPIVVENSFDKDLNAEVTLHNPDQKFEFAEVSNEITATKKIELYRRKRMNVKAKSSNTVTFMLTPTKAGFIEIKITATSSAAQDTVIKELLVVPDGETEYYTKSLLITFDNKNPTYKSNITIVIPKNVVEGSEKIEASVVGDLLGPLITNMDNLIRLPTGCGEQNLVHFMPSLMVLEYLRYSSQPTPSKEVEAIVNLEKAYQTQLSYRRSDGSFAVFGDRDGVGSVWVTAYVATAFEQAKRYIYVDGNVVESSLKWLSEQQQPNGSFIETGNVVNELLQDKTGKSLAMTAYAALAFLENQRSHPIYRNTIEKSLNYINANIREDDNVYAIAICTYVLQLAYNSSWQTTFDLLDSRATTSNNRKWWSQDTSSDNSTNPWKKRPRTPDVVATSYAILAFVERGLVEDALPALDWLLDQQNAFGGFTSSQDTVVGLQALYRMVGRLRFGGNVEVEYGFRERQTKTFGVNGNTAMIVQTDTLPKDVRLINVTARGSGMAVFRVSYQYNTNVTGPWPLFTLDPQVDKNSDIHHLQLSICTGFVNRNLSMSNESNMAVMEVNLPSGFTADVDSLPSLEVSQNVQKVETKNQDTTVVLYFNNLTQIEYCPTVSAYKTHKVAKHRSVPVVIYDYYDSSRRARVFYGGKRETLCDICEGEDCGDICSRERANKQIAEESKERESKSQSNAIIATYSFCIFTVFTIILF